MPHVNVFPSALTPHDRTDWTHKRSLTCAYAHTRAHMHAYAHMYTHVHTHVGTHIHTRTHTCTHSPQSHTCAHTVCTHTHLHLGTDSVWWGGDCLHTVYPLESGCLAVPLAGISPALLHRHLQCGCAYRDSGRDSLTLS